MKTKKITWPCILPLVAGSITLSSVLAQQVSTTEWIADPESPGNWQDSASWSDGVPIADSLAGILNGGTAAVTSPTAILKQLHVSAGSTLNIGSSLQVKGSNPIAEPPTPATGFYVNEGTINVLSGGNFEVDTAGVFLLGVNAPASLNLFPGGTLTSFNRLRVGNGAANGSLTPTNLVNQTGGDVTIFGRLDLGENPGPNNIYQISGGTLATTENVLVGFRNDGSGTFTVDGDADVDVLAVVMGENAGTNLTGTTGTVNLLGGVLTTGQIRVGNGVAADQSLILNGGTIRARTGGTTLMKM